MGHFEVITSVAFSRDGRFILSGSRDKTVKLWNTATGSMLRSFTGHSNFLKSAAFSPDDRLALSGGEDGTARLWELGTGRELRKFTEGYNGDPVSTAFSPDGRFILSGNYAGSLKLWDAAAGKVLWDTSEGELRRDKCISGIRAVMFSPGGRLVLSVCGGETSLRDAATGAVVRKLDGYFESAAFSPDGRFIAAGYDGLGLFETATGKNVRKFAGFGQGVQSIAFSPDGRSVVACVFLGCILWDAATGQELRKFPEAGYPVAFSPDGRFIVSGHDTLRMWDASTGSKLRDFGSNLTKIDAAAISPDGHLLVSGNCGMIKNWVCRYGALKLWDLGAGRKLRTFKEHIGWAEMGEVQAEGSDHGPASDLGRAYGRNLRAGFFVRWPFRVVQRQR